jgi:nucleoside phosphorylase
MLLIVIAHRAEAQEFINRKFKQEVDFHFKGLFRSNEDMLLISGEGIQNTTMRLTSVYTYFSHQIDRIINFGIAGSLNKNYQINQIYGIHGVFHELIHYPSYQCKETFSQVDCISALQPVLDGEYAGRLSANAGVVDRELWAIGAVCTLFAIPFKSYKLISDIAGDQTNIKEIKKNAPQFSKHLFDFYKKLSLAKEEW